MDINTVTQWLNTYWPFMVVAYWIAEKIVKLTPTRYDDITIDILWGGLKKLAGKSTPNP